jgi:ubiquinone/menaquinone biosynthesis C-methylase UbiE
MFKKQAGGNQLLDSREILENKIGLGYGNVVADLGCGPKAYLTFQSARIVGDRGIVYAVDIQKQVLSSVESHAKNQNLENIKTVWSNLEINGATKIQESSLDLGILNNVLFQSANMPEMIKESIRLIKAGGRLLVIDWKSAGAPLGPKMDLKVNPEKIKELCEVFGLKLEKEFEAGQYHFGLIFRK